MSSFAKKLRRGNAGDLVFELLALLFGLSVLAITFGIVFELWINTALSREKFGFGFLWSRDFNVNGGRIGALTVIYGTVVTAVIAIVLSGLVGVGIAAFLVEVAPRRLNRVVGFVVELLAAIPSIVYGFWGIFALAPWLGRYVVPIIKDLLAWLPIFSGPYVNASVFTASIVLAIMILPTVAAISRDVIEAVPDSQREGMLALGATRWEMFSRAVLPYAKNGVLGALILGMGRAAGETMAVTLIIGNNAQLFTSLFQQGATMASVIANDFGEAQGLFLSALLEIGLLLFAITFFINVGARLLVWFFVRDPKGGVRV
ncbi:phosphate ABC transporter permease subunit PstC [Rubrobacter calidifluminis]|uniref:phosphate ABC transporter permease subunit PstC n=1 Tax=Rubrobacter calidifluminis TaxID=1392640 RepID=UPI0023601093|nr:phosphate ABC transporter permease subunit PstC [Rubrobacter calidifluminis]